MSEDLTDYLLENGVRCRYLHSEVDTLKRIELLRDLRLGEYDVLVGINLLREGLDLPEVLLVAILDADKEGFLRSDKSLIQTIGRAARNVSGQVVMYADRIIVLDGVGDRRDQPSPREAGRLQHLPRRHPGHLRKKIADITDMLARDDEDAPRPRPPRQDTSCAQKKSNRCRSRSPEDARVAPLHGLGFPFSDLAELVQQLSKHRMHNAAAELQFEVAARLRDEISDLKKELRQMMEATK